MITWLRLLDLPGLRFSWSGDAPFRGVDPYLPWADATALAGLGRTTTRNGYPFVLEVRLEGRGPIKRLSKFPPFLELDKQLQIARVYREQFDTDHAVFTALVPRELVPTLRGTRMHRVGDEDYALGIRGIFSLPRISQYLTGDIPLAPKNIRPAIAVIDDGFPFAHSSFRALCNGKWHSRVRLLWDQGTESAGLPWRTSTTLGYGREMGRQDIEALLNAHVNAAGEVDEDACYAAARYSGLVSRRFTHASVVSDIAAGAPDPLAARGAPADQASGADIVFVQLPRTVVEEVSAGALQNYVLDALQYLGACVAKPGQADPLAVNLSYGTFAGPHDGTAPIDVGIEKFMAGRSGTALVIAAGNARDANAHAQLRIDPGKSARLRWLLLPDDPTETSMEIWLPEQDDAGGALQLRARLVPPGAAAADSPWVAVDEIPWCGVAAGGGVPICSLAYPSKVPNGMVGTMILASVAPTRPSVPSWTHAAPAGTWTVELENRGQAPVEVHAWIERDQGPFRPKQSRFEVPGPVRNDCTLGSFSHALSAIVVGACLDDADDQRPADYSGEGPARAPSGRKGPDVTAGADESLALPGLLAAGTRSAERVRLSGTSVAAPVVLRELVNRVLAAGMSNNAIKQQLMAKAVPRGPNELASRLGQGRFKSRKRP